MAAVMPKQLAWARRRNNPKSKQLRQDFKIARNRANAMLRSAKGRHYKNKFLESSRDFVKTWRLINELRGIPIRAISELEICFGRDAFSLVNDFNAYCALFSGVVKDRDERTLTFKRSVAPSAFLQ